MSTIKWGVLGSRLGLGILGTLLAGISGGQIPTTTGTLLAAVTGAAVAAAPSAFQAAGVFKAVTPGQISLAASLIGSVADAINARGQAKQDALTNLAQTAGAAAATAILQRTGQFTAEQLGGGFNLSYNSAPPATAPATPTVSAVVIPDPAVAATGGNQ